MKNYQLTDEQIEVLRFCAAIPTGLKEVLDRDNIPVFLLKYMQAYKNSVEKYNPKSNEEDFARIKELVIINELKSIIK